MARNNDRARELAGEFLARGCPTGWFEPLYQEAERGDAVIPWADLVPNPHLVAWLERDATEGGNRTAAVVGCGLGDDVVELERRGYAATGFDIAPTAIAWCRRRFPAAAAQFAVADLLALPAEWREKFALVFEAYTLQALPAPERRRGLVALAGLVAPRGQLVLVARGRDVTDPEGQLPWPLTREEVLSLGAEGLALERFEDFWDAEEPAKRRFRATFRRPG